MIELRNLHRYFDETRAVDNVSFRVYAGQVFGYIGPNGAGKTTSMRILATLDLPTAGDALIDGFSVVNDPDRVRYRLGFMPDYFGTYANVNVREYLDFFARAYQIRGQRRHDAVERVMGFTGLDVLAEKPTNGLSKGMKQRLCLGRSLIHDPAVLVLDEPAAGLDPRARIEVRSMIRSLANEGKAILISSHILTELAEVCDEVAIIEQGRLLAVGSVDEIRNQARPPQNAVEVRLLDDVAGTGAAELGRWLGDRSDVKELNVNGDSVRFLHAGTPEDEASLLRSMIEAGFRVIAFGSKDQTLEDVFMQVTEGRVQ
ncbi:MAG: ABC transporter ATP-binding protein [Candidatus Nealsonbacteria bacterium]|nr:ABC transporter ATP-binding protein [Candidatus Nealsonbacteria bacterium]